MENAIISGLFVVGGAAIGGLITYFSARVGHKWKNAQNQIVNLCHQVEAFYELEQLYKVEVAGLSDSGEHADTIMKKMRSKVSESGDFVRPEMTSNQARKIRLRWE